MIHEGKFTILETRGPASVPKNEPDLLVCAEAAALREGLDAISATNPGLVVTDLSIKRMRWPEDGEANTVAP